MGRRLCYRGRHSPSFLWKEVPRRGGGWLSQRDEVVRAAFPMIPLLTALLDRERKRFLASLRNDDAGRRYSLFYTFSLRSAAVFQLFYGNTAFFNESFSSFIQKPVLFIATMLYSDNQHSKRSGDRDARKASIYGIRSLRDFKGENNEKTYHESSSSRSSGRRCHPGGRLSGTGIGYSHSSGRHRKVLERRTLRL